MQLLIRILVNIVHCAREGEQMSTSAVATLDHVSAVLQYLQCDCLYNIEVGVECICRLKDGDCSPVAVKQQLPGARLLLLAGTTILMHSHRRKEAQPNNIHHTPP